MFRDDICDFFQRPSPDYEAACHTDYPFSSGLAENELVIFVHRKSFIGAEIANFAAFESFYNIGGVVG
jgi:hypothetical protein